MCVKENEYIIFFFPKVTVSVSLYCLLKLTLVRTCVCQQDCVLLRSSILKGNVYFKSLTLQRSRRRCHGEGYGVHCFPAH